MIILPRQARDKHREKAPKKEMMRFLTGFAPPVVKHVSKEGKLSIGPFGVCVVTAMQQ
eukprot:COSAG06_NODE_2807_length_6256_cov_8.116778_2_plen_58_part_00